MEAESPDLLHQSQRIKASHYLSYPLPLPAIILSTAAIAVLPGIYAKYYGMSLATIAAVILGARLFDAITDVLIGWFSDRHHARTGSRKVYMVAGGVLFVVAGYFLYVPPENVTVTYFAGWFIAYYLGWTLFEIPHLAWGGDLAKTTDEKTKIFSSRVATSYLGYALFYMIPLLPFFDTADITPETLRWVALATAALLLPALYLSMKIVPDGDRVSSSSKSENQIPAGKSRTRKPVLHSFIHNNPLLIFLGVFTFAGMGIGIWYGLIFIYVDVYLDMGDQFAQVFLYAFLFGIITTPFWYKLIARIGKKSAWCLVMLLYWYLVSIQDYSSRERLTCLN